MSEATGPQRAREPLVSVVIPCYNQAHFLSEALESVLDQSYRRIEAFVIDDGSTDNTRQITERYPTVQYRRQVNQGAAAARNAGLRESRGDLLVFLDADDRLLSWAVEAGVQALGENRTIACTVGACRDIGPVGEELDVPDQPLVHRDHYLALLRSCFILSGSSVLFSRWCLEAVGGFNPSYPTGDDYDLYLRIARRFPIECHGRVVTEYRRHADSLTGDPVRTLRGELGALRAQRSAVRSRQERAALRSGRRRARSAHSASLRWRLLTQVREREWIGAVRSALAMLRNHPTALVNALRDLWLARSAAIPADGWRGSPT
jgi:glycosyltransferase involved in cell wall biosynthesis